jgi:hypothetical protein
VGHNFYIFKLLLLQEVQICQPWAFHDFKENFVL